METKIKEWRQQNSLNYYRVQENNNQVIFIVLKHKIVHNSLPSWKWPRNLHPFFQKYEQKSVLEMEAISEVVELK